jgi:hypothetical protein
MRRGLEALEDVHSSLIATTSRPLNLLQHVFTTLKQHGRAAIVVPDNVLFERWRRRNRPTRATQTSRRSHLAPSADRHLLCPRGLTLDSMAHLIARFAVRSDDERSKNLILRLFSYSSRPEREPIEDYCTEALAWCLTQCPSLLTTVLPESISWLGGALPILQIDTQLPYHSGTAGHKPPEDADSGRFDLVVNGGVTEPAVIVIESKIESDFSPGQLKRYQDELCRRESFPEVAQNRRYLVALTTLRQDSTDAQGSITWPEIHHAISIASANQAPYVAGVFVDFADLLKERGISMLEMNKIDDRLVSDWFKVKKLEDQLRRILERLRNSKGVKSTVGRHQVKQDGNEWIGVYGINGFYAGFGFFHRKDKAEVVIWVEITASGDRRKLVGSLAPALRVPFEEARSYLKLSGDDKAINFNNLIKGTSRFVFVEPIHEKLNGDGEETFKSLFALAKNAITLAGGR